MTRPAQFVAGALVVLALAGCSLGGPADAADAVDVVGSLSEEAADAFEAMVADSGLPVRYWSVVDVERALRPGALRNVEPDVALVGDVGAFQRLAARNVIRPLPDALDDRLDDSLLPALEATATVDGARYGVPYRASLISLVWYAPDVFAQEGYEIPQTYDELLTLTAQMRADGWTPWCLGSESAQNSGWVLTDWIEELVLRSAGVDAYDRWADGDLPFDSSDVRSAADLFARLAFTEGNVRLGGLGIVGLSWDAAASSLVKDPPECLLNRQGSVLSQSFPGQAEAGEDYDVFAFPDVEPAHEGALLGGVDVAVAVSQREGVTALLTHLAQPEIGEEWIATAQNTPFLSPYRNFAPASYPDPVARRQAEILSQASVLRAEASRQLPFAVGEIAFRTELIDWVIGRQDLETTLNAIESVNSSEAP